MRHTWLVILAALFVSRTGTRLACLTMVFKLRESAAKHWRLLNGSSLLGDVLAGVVYLDGIKENAA